MVMTLKKGTGKNDIDDILRKLSGENRKSKGIDAYKYCGVIKLKESIKDIQKRLRSEWD